MYDLSIIIPAYNCRQYIGDCLNSILLQRDALIHQIIVVDDGSTDGTADIVRQYQIQAPNLELITQRNAGVSVARNVGIDAAYGEYITFVDADDMVGLNATAIQRYLQIPLHKTNVINAFRYTYRMPAGGVRLRFENTYFERMLNTAHKYDADMVVGSSFTVDSGAGFIGYNSHDRCAPDIPREYKNDIYRFVALNQCSILDSANYLLYRRDMLAQHDLRFTPGMQLNEDLLFAMQASLHANTIRTANEATYFYRRHSGSLSNINGCFPSDDKVWKTQAYIGAVILSDLRNLGYKRAYNLFQQQQIHAFNMLKYNGKDKDAVITCQNCRCETCEHCDRDAMVWAQIQKNIVNFKPKMK